MNLSPKVLKILLVIVVVGFGVAFYLQDVQHSKSTTHAWKANRYNLERFDKIGDLTHKINAKNWRRMKDSIQLQLDTLMILRFRKEVDSLRTIEQNGAN